MRSTLSSVRFAFFVLALTGALLAGCAKPTERLNAPPQGASAYPSSLQRNYTPMVDNAMLSDMSMSGIHFVPHQSELNANGVRRLQRYAQLMKTYGGTLHYEGFSDDDTLATARIENISDFLASAGVDRSEFKVELGMAGSRGGRAAEGQQYREIQPAGGEQAEQPASMGDMLKAATGQKKK